MSTCVKCEGVGRVNRGVGLFADCLRDCCADECPACHGSGQTDETDAACAVCGKPAAFNNSRGTEPRCYAHINCVGFMADSEVRPGQVVYANNNPIGWTVGTSANNYAIGTSCSACDALKARVAALELLAKEHAPAVYAREAFIRLDRLEKESAARNTALANLAEESRKACEAIEDRRCAEIADVVLSPRLAGHFPFCPACSYRFADTADKLRHYREGCESEIPVRVRPWIVYLQGGLAGMVAAACAIAAQWYFGL